MRQFTPTVDTPYTLHLTRALARRIEQADRDYFVTRLMGLHGLMGNRHGVALQRFGDAVGFVVRDLPDPHFNRVVNVRGKTEAYLDEILAWYDENGMHCRIDVSPADAPRRLLEAMARRGMYQDGFYAAMYGTPFRGGLRSGRGAELDVRLMTASDRLAVEETYVVGHGVPDDRAATVKDSISVLFDKPGMRLYGTYIEGALAAVAVMYVVRRTAYLVSAATLPGFRRRGCHAALIKRRLNDAVALGCDLAISHNPFLSPAQRNLERLGFRMAYTKAVWMSK